MDFTSLGLSEPVLKAVADAGYVQPTPIQAQAIPIVLTGRDVLGTAQTGTGKTAGFTLPLIDILAGGRVRARMPRALILEPTRELADQVAHSFATYGKYANLSMALLIGGVNYTDQEKLLDRGVDVLIATPGRLLDHFERGRVMLTGVQVFVIDEADRMLDMGFMPDVEKIGSKLPVLRQTLFFSATMPPEMRKLADKFLNNPKEIAVARQSTTAETVTQGLIYVGTRQKREALRTLIRNEGVKNAIIFCNRKRDVDILAKSLIRHGFDAQPLHGDMDQGTRTATLEKFKRNEIAILVASDVAARGLDVQGLTHVFNFDVPTHPEDYVHRIGRTGRAGMEGRAFTFGTEDDAKYIRAIQHLINREIPVVELTGFSPEAGEDGQSGEAGEQGGRGRERGRDRGGRDKGGRDKGGRDRNRRDRNRRDRGAPAGQAAADAAEVEKSVAEQPQQAEPVQPESKRAEPKSAEQKLGERKQGERKADRKPGDRPRRDAARGQEREPERAERQAERQTERHQAEPRQQDSRQDKQARQDQRRREAREDREPPVVGMGDHMPDFLRRPVRKAQRG